MLPLRHILLLVVLIASESTSSPRFKPRTPEDSGPPPLPVARTQASAPDDAPLPFDNDDDYLAEFTGFNQRGQLKNEFGENVTIADIFGRRNDKVVAFKPDVNATVNAVEKALEANPSLPRLSRAEILEIYENITTAVNQNLTSTVVQGKTRTISGSVPPEYKSREEYARALMLVLPFNAKDMSDTKVQELYTRRPVTRLVNDNEDDGSAKEKSKTNKNTAHQFPLPDYNELYLTSGPKLTRPTTSRTVYKQTINVNKTTDVTTARPQPSSVLKPVDIFKPHNRFEAIQQYVTSTKHRLNKTRVTMSTVRPLNGGVYIVPTGNPTHPNHRYEVTEHPNAQFVATKYVTRSTTQKPSIFQYQTQKPWSGATQNQQLTTRRKTSTTSRTPVIQYQEIRPFKPLPDDRNKPTGSEFNPVIDAKIRQNALGNNYVQRPSINQAQTVVGENVIPSTNFEASRQTTQPPKRDNNQFQFINNNNIRTTKPPPVRNDIKDILASLGLFPDTNENPSNSYVTTKASTPAPTPKPDLSAGAESLTPEMQEMLKSFGLLPTSTDDKPFVHHSTKKSKPRSTPPGYTAQPSNSNINAAAYSNFKQIPESKKSVSQAGAVSGDMQQFLASFGLVPQANIKRSDVAEDRIDGAYRTHKSINTAIRRTSNHLVNSEGNKEKIAKINTEMLTDNMKRVLQSLGLLKIEENPEKEEDELLVPNASEHAHVFNPVVHLASRKQSNEETEKLNRLLDTIENLSVKNDKISQDQKLNQLLDTVQFLTKSNITLTQQDIDELNAALTLKPGDVINEEVRPVYIPKRNKDKSKTPLDEKPNPPDPVIDDLIGAYIKNEIKRQQPNGSSDATTAASTTVHTYPPKVDVDAVFPQLDEDTTTTTTTTTTTEASASDDTSQAESNADETETLTATTENTEERNPSLLADLADSFGGGAVAEEAPKEEELPPKRPNGLYFLLDWNSFLEVGEEGKNKVSVRIAPKVGDPKNFYPVTVP